MHLFRCLKIAVVFIRIGVTVGTVAVSDNAATGVLFGSNKAHRTLRTNLVEQQKLDAIVSAR